MIDELLEIIPASLGRVERRKEGAGATEVIGLNETDGGAGELADSAGVDRGPVTAGDSVEDGEVERARGIETGVVSGEGRKGESEENREEEEEGKEGH